MENATSLAMLNSVFLPLDNSASFVSTFALVERQGSRAMSIRYQYPILARDLPIPADCADLVAKLQSKTRSRLGQARTRFDESIRLRANFGGMHVVCVRTDLGLKVYGAGFPGTGELSEALARIATTEAMVPRIEMPEPLADHGLEAVSSTVHSR